MSLRQWLQIEASGDYLLSCVHSCLAPAGHGPWQHSGDHGRPGPLTLSASGLLRKQFGVHGGKPIEECLPRG